jgi:hypothetical protein
VYNWILELLMQTIVKEELMAYVVDLEHVLMVIFVLNQT